MNSEAALRHFPKTSETSGSTLRSRQGGAKPLWTIVDMETRLTLFVKDRTEVVVFVKLVCGHTVETVPVPIYDR